LKYIQGDTNIERHTDIEGYTDCEDTEIEREQERDKNRLGNQKLGPGFV